MTAKRHRKVMIPILALLILSLTLPAWAGGGFGNLQDVFGPHFTAAPHHHTVRHKPPRPGSTAMARLRHWNEVAIDMSGLDHTPVAPGETRLFGEQYGPTRHRPYRPL